MLSEALIRDGFENTDFEGQGYGMFQHTIFGTTETQPTQSETVLSRTLYRPG